MKNSSFTLVFKYCRSIDRGVKVAQTVKILQW